MGRTSCYGLFPVEAPLSDSWTLEVSGGARAIAVSENRLGVICSTGSFYAKNGLSDCWTLEFNRATAIALSDIHVGVIDVGGTFYAKQVLTDAWTLETGGGAEAMSSPDQP